MPLVRVTLASLRAPCTGSMGVLEIARTDNPVELLAQLDHFASERCFLARSPAAGRPGVVLLPVR